MAGPKGHCTEVYYLLLLVMQKLKNHTWPRPKTFTFIVVVDYGRNIGLSVSIKCNLGPHTVTLLSTFTIWELSIMPTLVVVIANISKSICMVISVMRGRKEGYANNVCSLLMKT